MHYPYTLVNKQFSNTWKGLRTRVDLCVSDCELACSMMTLWGKGSLGESSRFHEGMLHWLINCWYILKRIVTRLLVKPCTHGINEDLHTIKSKFIHRATHWLCNLMLTYSLCVPDGLDWHTFVTMTCHLLNVSFLSSDICSLTNDMMELCNSGNSYPSNLVTAVVLSEDFFSDTSCFVTACMGCWD